MHAWIGALKGFGWLVVVLMLAAIGYAALRVWVLYPSISV